MYCSSDEARNLGFTVLVDMRGSTWSTVKPILKALHEHFPQGAVHQALIVKPDNFWQKQRTSLGSHKYKFEVSRLVKIREQVNDLKTCILNINCANMSVTAHLLMNELLIKRNISLINGLCCCLCCLSTQDFQLESNNRLFSSRQI